MHVNLIEYFLTIVEENFNMTKAAQLLHISQPALSKAITKFEIDNNVIIFKRSRGRFIGLTPAGITLYTKGKEIVNSYNNMMSDIMLEANEVKGSVSIGISPVIISQLFYESLPKFIRENPKINLSIHEKGAVNLKSQLINDEINIATLLDPTGLDPTKFEQVSIAKNALAIFVDKNNELASKNSISLHDLQGKSLALFNDSYMINQQITDLLSKNNIFATVQLKSDSWDLLLNATINSNLITILPKPIANFHNMNRTVMIDFDDNIKWHVFLCRKKKKVYSRVEEYTYNYFVEYYENHI